MRPRTVVRVEGCLFDWSFGHGRVADRSFEITYLFGRRFGHEAEQFRFQCVSFLDELGSDLVLNTPLRLEDVVFH